MGLITNSCIVRFCIRRGYEIEELEIRFLNGDLEFKSLDSKLTSATHGFRVQGAPQPVSNFS